MDASKEFSNLYLNENETFLLQEAIMCGKFESDVLGTIINMQKEKVLSVHPYAITKQSWGKHLFQTYIMDEVTGTRQRITAATEQGLYKKLYDIYFVNTVKTLETFYPDWIEKRYSIGINPRTIHRNENHWDKYYKNHSIVKMPLHKITAEKIEDFLHYCITTYSLTVKELGNMKFILLDMMKLAKKRNLIEYNPFVDVEVHTNACRPTTKQNDISRVYLPEEKEKLFRELNNELVMHPEVTDMYAIFLLFKLGLRVGELCALKWEDINEVAEEIHIHRMESKDEKGREGRHSQVVEYTKKKSPYGDRFLPIGDYERDLFAKVRAINKAYGYDSEFIFCDENGRTNIRSIDNRIRKCCKRADIEVKSAHDIRRTVASEMFNNGVPVEIIRNFLGHSDIKTTYGYILDNKKKEDTCRMIYNALRSMNGLKIS